MIYHSSLQKKETNYIRYLTPLSHADPDSSFTNILDPDEMANNEPSHQDLHYLPFCFDF